MHPNRMIENPAFSSQVLESFDLKELEKMEDKGRIEGIRGFSPATRRLNAVQNVRVAEASKLWERAIAGDVHPFILQQAFRPTQDFAFEKLCRDYPKLFNESMTSSDFALLSDQILDKMVLANYQVYAPTWQTLAKVRQDIKDFRAVRSYYFDGGKAMFDKVKEKAGFDRRTLNSSNYEYFVEKYEAGYEVSWEAVINDNLGFFQEMPRNLSIGGNNTIENFVTSLYVDANGPHATFYTGGQGNIITANPALSIESLQAAMAQWMNFQDSDGVPITISGMTLVVGDGALFVKAQNIKHMLVADITNNGGTSAERLRVDMGWFVSGLNIVYNPWIRKVATTSNAATSWWLFANAAGGARPALEIGFLSGYNGVQLYRKASNTVGLGGGANDILGDFETMSTEYKGLIVFGGMRGDFRSTIASNGTGS